MVDLPLMAWLMAALPAGCGLILLGDRNQLASVQPGAVLGDICQGLRDGGLSHVLAGTEKKLPLCQSERHWRPEPGGEQR